MGFNVSGLVINQNYENKINQLQEEFKWNIRKESEIDFETASSNWKEAGILDFYFSESGTLIFMNIDMCTDSFRLKNANTLTFALSETSMAFNVNYCENGILKRSIMEVNNDRFTDDGEKLSVEDKSSDTSEIIWNQMEVLLGKKFWSIEPDEKAIRYFVQKNSESKPKVKNNLSEDFHNSKKLQEIVVKDLLNNGDIKSRVTKKWWQFWK